MAKYIGNPNYHQQKTPASIGIMLVNLGSPDAPTASAVRRYLAEFLSDPRMIEIPKPIWQLILHGIILRVRPKKSAHAYSSIWTEQGSPLIAHTNAIKDLLQQRFVKTASGTPVHIETAMCYGNPSMEAGIATLAKLNAQKILILPLFPQYSAATQGSVFDKVAKVLKKYRYLPALRFVNQYADEPAYIDAIAQQLKQHWQQHGRSDKLLFSFHGLPKRNLRLGDPYYCYCHKTVRLVAQALGLAEDDYQLVFQSRFGKAEWLKPYCEDTLVALAKAGHKTIDLICPGFAADCLETLEEIAIRYQETFIAAGGKQLRYIPALNANNLQIDLLENMITTQCHDWLQAPCAAPPSIAPACIIA